MPFVAIAQEKRGAAEGGKKEQQKNNSEEQKKVRDLLKTNTFQDSRPIKAKPHQAERKEAGKFPGRKKEIL